MESARSGASGMEAAKELGVPAERGWNEGVERSETRMQGQAFLDRRVENCEAFSTAIDAVIGIKRCL